MTDLSRIIDMDPLHNSPSFLKLIEEDFPIFLQIPNDFASMIWGDQPPYKDSVKIVDGNKLWFVRVKKTDVGPVLADGFTKVVRDSCVRKDDYLIFQSYGPSSFFLMVFKSFVHKNCFISKISPHEDVIVMADEFWMQFYGKNFKGGQSTLYLGDRFWNVNLDGLTDSCVFTHGCSEIINDLAFDRRSTFVFSLHGNKIFELSVFNHQTGTQIQNNRVELVVLDDSIYGDDGGDFLIASEHKEKCSSAGTDFQEGVVVECEDDKFQLASFEYVFNDIDDSKFDNFFSSLLEMEDLKKKFKDDWDTKTEPQGKARVVCDEDLTLKDDPKAKTIVGVDKDDKNNFETDLDKFFIPKNKSHVDPAGKTNVVFSEPSLCSTFVSDAIPKYTVDVAQSVLPRKRKATRKCKTFMIVSDESLIAHRTRSKFRNKNESVVVDKITAAETASVSRKRSALKRSKTVAIIEFTKVAENRMRLSSAVSEDLYLSIHNLRDVSLQNLRCEVTNMKTIAEKNGNGYRYGFSKWSAFLKSIKSTSALLFSLNMSRLRSF
ncbi:putative transcription factor B3-Domain family [Helianthus annuus]|nr:putative transcription factor B3-Domain family [Helianthus annuus]